MCVCACECMCVCVCGGGKRGGGEEKTGIWGKEGKGNDIDD